MSILLPHATFATIWLLSYLFFLLYFHPHPLMHRFDDHGDDDASFLRPATLEDYLDETIFATAPLEDSYFTINRVQCLDDSIFFIHHFSATKPCFYSWVIGTGDGCTHSTAAKVLGNVYGAGDAGSFRKRNTAATHIQHTRDAGRKYMEEKLMASLFGQERPLARLYASSDRFFFLFSFVPLFFSLDS